MGAEERVFRDPIYGYISVEEPLVEIVDHWMFQRLRRISQTSLTSYVYPSATGSRFEHALGSMHLARRAWTAIWGRKSDSSTTVRDAFRRAVRADHEQMLDDDALFGERMGLAFRAAALLHDVGHGPFSHALEEVFKSGVWSPDPESVDRSEREVLENGLKFHEFCGRLIAKRICEDVFADENHELFRQEVPEVILQIVNDGPAPWARTLHRLISGQIDVDRIDYLIRDSHKAAGSEFGSIDYVRLLDALELYDGKRREGGRQTFTVIPWARARSAVETLLIQRLQAYEYIHFHPRVVGFNLALERAMELFLELSKVEGSASGVAPIRYPFHRVRPSLVFWDPDGIDLAGALALQRPPGGTRASAQASLDELNDAEELVQKLDIDAEGRLIAAAGVDDGTVLETLKHAYLIATSAAGWHVPEPAPVLDQNARENLRRFRIYTRAALFRRKNFAPAWKSAEEYLDSASEMRATLLWPAVEKLRERAAANGAEAEVLGAFASRIQQALDDPTVAGMRGDQRVGAAIALNRLVDLLLFRADIRKAIREGLNKNPAIGRTKGVWDLRYVGDGPAERLQVWLQSARGVVEIAERSPLAEAVWLAEQRRVKLAVFFFCESHDYSEPGTSAAGTLRGQVRTETVKRLPALILDAIETYV
jgi:HD superfamily phosphohydrolase